MTPGQIALAEAARIETARIYSQTCPEHRTADEPTRPARARSIGSYSGPAAPHLLAELVDALAPVRAVRAVA